MSAVYEYTCRKCGVVVEYDRILADNSRHMVDRKVCGSLRRVWSSINVNRQNLRNH